MLVMIVAIAVIGIVAWVVWGYVVLRLADLGVKHPAHKSFLVDLARSKKLDLPTIALGKIGKVERNDYNDNSTKQ